MLSLDFPAILLNLGVSASFEAVESIFLNIYVGQSSQLIDNKISSEIGKTIKQQWSLRF
jgi:hypothetical protein